jgi:hypothetical protein
LYSRTVIRNLQPVAINGPSRGRKSRRNEPAAAYRSNVELYGKPVTVTHHSVPVLPGDRDDHGEISNPRIIRMSSTLP